MDGEWKWTAANLQHENRTGGKGKRKATVASVEDIGNTIVHSNPKISAKALVRMLKATHGVGVGERSAGKLESAVLGANKAQSAEEYAVLDFLKQLQTKSEGTVTSVEVSSSTSGEMLYTCGEMKATRKRRPVVFKPGPSHYFQLH